MGATSEQTSLKDQGTSGGPGQSLVERVGLGEGLGGWGGGGDPERRRSRGNATLKLKGTSSQCVHCLCAIPSLSVSTACVSYRPYLTSVCPLPVCHTVPI